MGRKYHISQIPCVMKYWLLGCELSVRCHSRFVSGKGRRVLSFLYIMCLATWIRDWWWGTLKDRAHPLHMIEKQVKRSLGPIPKQLWTGHPWTIMWGINEPFSHSNDWIYEDNHFVWFVVDIKIFAPWNQPVSFHYLSCLARALGTG